MSVSKIRHDSIAFTPIEPVTAQTDGTAKGKKPSTAASAEAQEFWFQFNQTLDDFFRTIHSSKEHIKRLTERVAERDQQIEILSAENAVLREQLECQGLRQSVQAADERDESSSRNVTPQPDTPRGTMSESRTRRSIWSRLSGFDESTPLDNRRF